MSVVQLVETPLVDITGMLRKLADDIEAGNYGDVIGVAVVVDGPEMPVFGFGRASALHASELFACAHHRLIQQRLENCGA